MECMHCCIAQLVIMSNILFWVSTVLPAASGSLLECCTRASGHQVTANIAMASGGRDQAVSSSQGYSPNGANGGAGSQGQGPQQYRQQGPQQTAPQDWEATGGLSPSQQQAVQELTDMGFDPRQSQVHLLYCY